MRKPIIAGNWKCFKTSKEAAELVTLLKRQLSEISDVDIVVCPPFTALTVVNDLCAETNIAVGAQNVYFEDSGAFTGEVSAPMIKEEGCRYVIIGHSERRQLFGETNATVNKKILAALNHELTPIVCVGEILEERESGKTMDVIKSQFGESFDGLTAEQFGKLIIAYEPVWAIGTGKTATPEQAQEVHAFIRDLAKSKYGDDVSEALRIQYGGSVKPENTADLISQKDIDGALVGGASLKADSFVQIIKNACGVKT